MAKPERTLIPFSESRELTFEQFDEFLKYLETDLTYARQRFDAYTLEIRQREIKSNCIRSLLNDLQELSNKYEEDVAKLNAYSALVKDKIDQVETSVGMLENIDYNPISVNQKRVQMYNSMVTFNDDFLKDVKLMTELKLALKQLDDLMIKLYGIEKIKSDLSLMINLLSFLNKRIEHLESETKLELQKLN